jgi:hypothetical protein
MTDSATLLYKALHRKRAYTKLYWDVANVIGIYEALLIEIVERWCELNQEKGKRNYFQDGEWWTSATYQEWAARYPKLGSWKSIQRMFLYLEKAGYILSGKFTKGSQTKYYRVNSKSIGQLLVSGTLQEEIGIVSESDSTVSKTDSTVSESDGIVSESDVHLYTDQIIQSEHSTKTFNQIPPTPQRECEVELVESEIVQPEEELTTPSLTLAVELTKVESKNETSRLDKSSGVCDNKSTPTLLERYENGEIDKLPRHELIKASKERLGGIVKTYRVSGVILGTNPNDIDRGFLNFIAKRDRKDTEYASRLVLACERKPERWGELTEMVASWKSKEVLNGYSKEQVSRAHEIFKNIADL